MQYNYDFEIMSLVIFVVISGHFLLIRQFPTVKSKVFGRLLGVCLGECIANILSCIGLANAAIVPLIWNELFTFAFFALEGAASYLMFRYMEEVCSFSGVAGRMIKYMGKVPFFFFEIMLLATPWMGFFFYFKDGSYYQGNFAWFGYVLTICCISSVRSFVFWFPFSLIVSPSLLASMSTGLSTPDLSMNTTLTLVPVFAKILLGILTTPRRMDFSPSTK